MKKVTCYLICFLAINLISCENARFNFQENINEVPDGVIGPDGTIIINTPNNGGGGNTDPYTIRFSNKKFTLKVRDGDLYYTFKFNINESPFIKAKMEFNPLSIDKYEFTSSFFSKSDPNDFYINVTYKRYKRSYMGSESYVLLGTYKSIIKFIYDPTAHALPEGGGDSSDILDKDSIDGFKPFEPMP